MPNTTRQSMLVVRMTVLLAVIQASLLVSSLAAQVTGQAAPDEQAVAAAKDRLDNEAAIRGDFESHIQPLLKKYCHRCHHADNMESGIRVDRLDGRLADSSLRLWENIQRQVSEQTMPPEDEPPLTSAERERMAAWIDRGLAAARSRPAARNGSVRRLTIAQYRNTLRDLLGIDDDLTDILPPDAVSKDGFLNNQDTMLLSPLLLEAYFTIADRALDRCLVDEQTVPQIQNFRMDLGAGINPDPCPDQLILGALSHLLQNQDFMVTQLTPEKPFAYEPFFMRTKYRFIEGYQGNDTVRGWREYDSIYHAVFACMRGSDGYPKGRAYQTVPAGLLLRPAIPSAELFQVESTYGPKANFKISLRELPDTGRFRVTVRAARYDDGLLLDPGTAARDEQAGNSVVLANPANLKAIDVPQAGIYQVDMHLAPLVEGDKPNAEVALQLGQRHFTGNLTQPAFLVVRLPAGSLEFAARYSGKTPLDRIVLTPLNDADEAARRFLVFEQRVPRIGVHVGLRRDCGSTLTQVGDARPVESTELVDYTFEGAISNFPSPDVEKDNVNYLAGVREIGVRSEFTDGRDMPRLLIRSVEFEGPLHETWPPASHRNIFIDSAHTADHPTYAREIINSFASRAFRRPLTEQESANLFTVWQSAYGEQRDFRQSIKDTLLVVLTSPQFLFLIENSQGPDAEAIDDWELASKLSYFLWNTAPDQRLLDLAAAGKLRESLDGEIERLIADPRFRQFTSEFAAQWLSLDKFDVVEIDRQRYPRLTRDTRTQLRQEPVEFLDYLIRQNLPLSNLIDSDFVVANEVVASYYGLEDRIESGFEFQAIRHDDPQLGGVLTQASILAGLSDGREGNPVKRGAWLARKIIAEPPADPPPNVPALPEDDSEQLTLRQKLERHRNQKGCAKCHAGIDPWGIPFEEFDAAGRYRTRTHVDARSTLPDQTEVASVRELKRYLADDRLDQVAFSVLKHLATYATGRQLGYNEIEFLRKAGLELKDGGYRMQDLVRFVITSELFLTK